MPSPVTITATFNDPSGAALQGNSFLRFKLRNFAGFVPQVSGTSILPEILVDALPNGSGLISQLLWANNVITPATTFYTVELWNQGRITSSGNYIFNGNTNLNTSGQINTPPVPPGFSLVLENNGALNSSQSTLNLESTDSSVVITDLGSGNINLQASTNSFTTAGQSYFAGPGLPPPIQAYGSTISNNIFVTSNNQVKVTLFILLYKTSVSRITYKMSTTGAGTLTFGLYDASLNKVLDSGTFNTNISTIQTNTITPVILVPGVYWFAQSASTTVPSGPGLGVSSSVPADLANKNFVRFATAANVASGGVLPATLGVLTADDTIVSSIPIFEP